WAPTSTIPTAPMLATLAVSMRMSPVARFGSTDLALAAVSAGCIGQITSQIQVQKMTAVTSQPIAGAYAQFHSAPASASTMTPTVAETPIRKLVLAIGDACRS